jgi:FixJ family two-component response regulator
MAHSLKEVLLENPRSSVVHVVDDDEAVRDSTRALLETHGFEVRDYASAREFLGTPVQSRGCVLLDLHMPGMSGLELQERLNEMNVGIPIILLTAYAEVPIAVKAMKAGAIDVIQKPYSQQVLLDRIQQALARDRANRQRVRDVKDAREKLGRLTQGERDVLERLRAGMSNKEIAGELGLTRRGIEARRANIMRKLEADSLADLLRMVMISDAQATSDKGQKTESGT